MPVVLACLDCSLENCIQACLDVGRVPCGFDGFASFGLLDAIEFLEACWGMLTTPISVNIQRGILNLASSPGTNYARLIKMYIS